MKEENFEVYENTQGRAGSYWNQQDYMRLESDSGTDRFNDSRLTDKSFHVNIGKFTIKDNYIYDSRAGSIGSFKNSDDI